MEPEKKIAKVLVSACLTGRRVRYDGAVISETHSILNRWEQERRVVPFCPEVAGGLPVPRPPAECSGGDGRAVLGGHCRVLNVNGEDITTCFVEGATRTVELTRLQEIKIAVLKDGSPSCGSTYIYDGSFSETRMPGKGVTSVLLEAAGIRVFCEREFREADACLRGL